MSGEEEEAKNLILAEEDYNEEEDDDFNPEAAAGAQESSSEESETEQKLGTNKRVKTTAKPQKKPRIDQQDAAAEDLDFENSGDEGIIKEGTKQERKRRKKRKDEEQDDSGGEGGFVKTRSMRAAADPAVNKVSGVLAGKATADIDAIWAKLKSGSLAPTSTKPEEDTEPVTAEDSDMITIQRTYTFAGKIHTETKTVPRSSAQAQAYLATKDQRAGADQIEIAEPEEIEHKKGPEGQILVRPLRRVSAWEPNSTGFIKGVPEAPTMERVTGSDKNRRGEKPLKVVDKKHLGSDAILWQRAPTEFILKAGRAILKNTQGSAPVSGLTKQMKAQRLNVVDKSKLDWAEHVDATGSREELEKAKKDKRSFLERKDFLARVEDKAEDERAKARGVVK